MPARPSFPLAQLAPCALFVGAALALSCSRPERPEAVASASPGAVLSPSPSASMNASASASTPPADPSSDACVARTMELKRWLRALADEGGVDALSMVDPKDSYHFVDRPLPQVALVSLGGPAALLPATAALTLVGQQLSLFDTTVDVTSASERGRVLAQIATKTLVPGFGRGGAGQMYTSAFVILMIDETTPWSSVVALTDALTRKGYGPFDLAFGVATRVTPPRDSEALRTFTGLATSQAEMPWQRVVHEVDTLRTLLPHCAVIADAARWDPNQGSMDPKPSLEALATKAPSLVDTCGCASADPDVIKAFAWARAGRMWGPLTRTVTIENVRPNTTDGARHDVALPGDTPWKDAAPRVLEAVDAGQRVSVRFSVSK